MLRALFILDTFSARRPVTDLGQDAPLLTTDHRSSPSGPTPACTASYPLGILSSRGGSIREAPRAGRRPARTLILAYSIPDVKNYLEPTQGARAGFVPFMCAESPHAVILSPSLSF